MNLPIFCDKKKYPCLNSFLFQVFNGFPDKNGILTCEAIKRC